MTERHITWESFERDFVQPGVPAEHPVIGRPLVRVFFRPYPSRIGLEIAVPHAIPLPPSELREIEVANVSGPRGSVIVVWTTNEQMFRPFFSVLLEIADAVQLESATPIDAVRLAVERFAAVIERDVGLATEKKIGLWGELWLLERLLATRGEDALAAWTGFHRDRHDFRMGGVELEVKTTLATASEHVINGLWQLAPSTDHELFLVSIQLQRSAAGATLDGRVRAVDAQLAAGSIGRETFDRSLARLGLTREQIQRDAELFVLRRPPWVVPVAPPLPMITESALTSVLGADALARLDDVHYRINVTSLGHAPGTDLFDRLLPRVMTA